MLQMLLSRDERGGLDDFRSVVVLGRMAVVRRVCTWQMARAVLGTVIRARVGGTCARVGVTATSGKTKLVCKKSGKKTVWVKR